MWASLAAIILFIRLIFPGPLLNTIYVCIHCTVYCLLLYEKMLCLF